MNKCKQNVWGGWHFHPCPRKAWRDGWCKQHHPDTKKARDEAGKQKYEEKRKLSPWYRLEVVMTALKDNTLAEKVANPNGLQEHYKSLDRRREGIAQYRAAVLARLEGENHV